MNFIFCVYREGTFVVEGRTATSRKGVIARSAPTLRAWSAPPAILRC